MNEDQQHPQIKPGHIYIKNKYVPLDDILCIYQFTEGTDWAFSNYSYTIFVTKGTSENLFDEIRMRTNFFTSELAEIFQQIGQATGIEIQPDNKYHESFWSLVLYPPEDANKPFYVKNDKLTRWQKIIQFFTGREDYTIDKDLCFMKQYLLIIENLG